MKLGIELDEEIIKDRNKQFGCRKVFHFLGFIRNVINKLRKVCWSHILWRNMDFSLKSLFCFCFSVSRKKLVRNSIRAVL